MNGYNAAVEQYFYCPPRPCDGDYRGEAGSIAAGTWIRVSASVSAGQLHNVGFRAFACPHIIAACHWLSEQLEGQAAEMLAAIDRQDMQHLFDMPVEKAGKLLILQDAFANLLADIRMQADSREEPIEKNDGN